MWGRWGNIPPSPPYEDQLHREEEETGRGCFAAHPPPTEIILSHLYTYCQHSPIKSFFSSPRECITRLFNTLFINLSH